MTPPARPAKPVTLEDIIDEVSRGTYAVRHQISPKSIQAAWSGLTHYIAAMLRSNKGVSLPVIGTFFVAPVRQGDDKRVSQAVRPCFQLLEGRFLGVNQEKTAAVPAGRVGTLVQPNFSSIMRNVRGLHRVDTQRMVRDLLQRIGIHILSGKPISVNFPEVGLLATNKKQRLQFTFNKEVERYFALNTKLTIPAEALSTTKAKAKLEARRAGADAPLATAQKDDTPKRVQFPQHVKAVLDAGDMGHEALRAVWDHCAGLDKMGSGVVPRNRFEDALHDRGSNLLQGVSAAALLDLFSSNAYGTTGKFVCYPTFLDALSALPNAFGPDPNDDFEQVYDQDYPQEATFEDWAAPPPGQGRIPVQPRPRAAGKRGVKPAATPWVRPTTPQDEIEDDGGDAGEAAAAPAVHFEDEMPGEAWPGEGEAWGALPPGEGEAWGALPPGEGGWGQEDVEDGWVDEGEPMDPAPAPGHPPPRAQPALAARPAPAAAPAAGPRPTTSAPYDSGGFASIQAAAAASGLHVSYFHQHAAPVGTRSQCDDFNKMHFARLRTERGGKRGLTPKVGQERLTVDEASLARSQSPPRQPAPRAPVHPLQTYGRPPSAAPKSAAAALSEDLAPPKPGNEKPLITRLTNDTAVAARRRAQKMLLRQSWDKQIADKKKIMNALHATEQAWPFQPIHKPELRMIPTPPNLYANY